MHLAAVGRALGKGIGCSPRVQGATPLAMRSWLVAHLPYVPTLSGRLVRLEPLGLEHVEVLARAAEEDRAAYDYTFVPTAATAEHYVEAQLGRAATGAMRPMAQIRLSDERPWGTLPSGIHGPGQTVTSSPLLRSAGRGSARRRRGQGSTLRRSCSSCGTPSRLWLLGLRYRRCHGGCGARRHPRVLRLGAAGPSVAWVTSDGTPRLHTSRHDARRA